MMTYREAIEYFIVAKLMSVWANEGYGVYVQCRDFLSPEMFTDKKLRWVYKTICAMYEEGWKSTCEDDIAQYIIGKGDVPEEKIGSICCFLIEVYIQFCGMTNPLTGVKWTIDEAVNEMVRQYDMGIEIAQEKMVNEIVRYGR